MQIKAALTFLFGAIMTMGVIASPLPHHDRRSMTSPNLATRENLYSFNNWGGFDSLNGFDDFFGADNFIGINNQQVIINEQVVCRAQHINVIQRQLLVLQELAKRIVLEQICEVEVQVIILQQFQSGFNGFSNDLFRRGGRSPGYDQSIAGFGSQLFNSDGSFNVHDLGFSGHDLGRNIVSVGGSNWDDNKSPSSVQGAFDASEAARLASLQFALQGVSH